MNESGAHGECAPLFLWGEEVLLKIDKYDMNGDFLQRRRLKNGMRWSMMYSEKMCAKLLRSGSA